MVVAMSIPLGQHNAMTMHELECKSAVFPAVSNCSVHYNSDIQYVYCVSKFNVENVIKAKYAIYCAGRGAGGDCDQHRCTTSCSRRSSSRRLQCDHNTGRGQPPDQTWTRCLTMFGISAVTNDIEYWCQHAKVMSGVMYAVALAMIKPEPNAKWTHIDRIGSRNCRLNVAATQKPILSKRPN